MTSTIDSAAPKPSREPVDGIFAIDIGGTLIKSALIDDNGNMLSSWRRQPTPQIRTPSALLSLIEDCASLTPRFNRISIAFPGHVLNGQIFTAPNLGNRDWYKCPFADQVSQRLGVETRVLNDAIVQGLGVVNRPGLSGILTFGTGMGCAVFRDCSFLIQLELGQHPSPDGVCYDDAVGHNAFVSLGPAIWNTKVERAIGSFKGLVQYDHLYVGGGNARHIENVDIESMTLVPNTAGITGGARMWHPDAEAMFNWRPSVSTENAHCNLA
jgi:polyphosphate glucokinase